MNSIPSIKWFKFSWELDWLWVLTTYLFKESLYKREKLITASSNVLETLGQKNILEVLKETQVDIDELDLV